MPNRDLTPALSERELHDAGQVFRHAQQRTAVHGVVTPSKRALVVVHCNQLAPDNASKCDWERSIESTVIDAELDGRRAIGEHLRSAHPYLTSGARRSLVGNAWVNLRDFTGGR